MAGSSSRRAREKYSCQSGLGSSAVALFQRVFLAQHGGPEPAQPFVRETLLLRPPRFSRARRLCSGRGGIWIRLWRQRGGDAAGLLGWLGLAVARRQGVRIQQGLMLDSEVGSVLLPRDARRTSSAGNIQFDKLVVFAGFSFAIQVGLVRADGGWRVASRTWAPFFAQRGSMNGVVDCALSC